MRKIIIAIDGYSACGKSTTAKQVAARLGYSYIDTGAMYRATALYFHEHYVSLSNPSAVSKALEETHVTFHFNEKLLRSETYLNGLNVEEEIRKMYISNMVSEVSAIAEIRRHMVHLQRKMGKQKGVVMDGRDIGTEVFPEAELKIFMNADMEVRAARRQAELLGKKQVVDLGEVLDNLKKRDLIDTTREEGPLRKAEDAHEVDTTFITVEEQVDYILNLATTKIIENLHTLSDI